MLALQNIYFFRHLKNFDEVDEADFFFALNVFKAMINSDKSSFLFFYVANKK